MRSLLSFFSHFHINTFTKKHCSMDAKFSCTHTHRYKKVTKTNFNIYQLSYTGSCEHRHKNIQTQTHTQTHTDTHTHTYIRKHTHTQAHRGKHTYTYIQNTHTHNQHTHTHTYTNTHKHTHTQTHTHTHTHTHTLTIRSLPWCASCLCHTLWMCSRLLLFWPHVHRRTSSRSHCFQ